MQAYSGFKRKKSRLGSTLTVVAALHLAAAGGLVWLASTETGREILAVYKVNILNLPLPAPKPSSQTSEADAEGEGASPPGGKGPAAASPPPASPPPVEAKAEAPPPEPSPDEEAAAESQEGEDSETASDELPTEVVSLGPSGASLGEFSGESPGVEGPGGEGDGPGPAGIEGISGGAIRLPGSGNPFAGGGGGGNGSGGGRGGRKFSGYADLVTSEIQKYYKQPADLLGGIPLAVLFQLRLDEEGRLLEFKLMRSSGNPRFDESALQALSNVKHLRPPPQGMSKTLTVKFFPPSG